jgi:hypothetical protein
VEKSDAVLFPCTPLQSGMFGTTAGDRSAYAIQLYWRVVDGSMVPKLLEGWKAVVKRHRLLSSHILSTSEGFYQVIEDDSVGELRTVNQRFRQFLHEDLERGFGEDSSSLSRVTVVTDHDRRYVVLTLHHCVYDGWTLGFLIDDWVEATAGREVRPTGSFVDFVRYHQGQDFQGVQNYWKEYLEGVEASTVFSRPRDDSPEGLNETIVETVEFQSSREDIQKAASRAKTTVANLFRIGWALTLQVMTAKEDVVFGEVVSGRDVPIENIER